MLLNPPMAWSATRLLGHVDQSPERLSALVRELPDASADDVADALHRYVSHGHGPAGPPDRRERWWLVPASALDPAGEPGGRSGPWRTERLADELELITRGAACAVRFVDDIFVPTCDGTVTRDSPALARELEAT